MISLKDKVVIITGGGRGIGYGLSTAFAKAGAKLVITGRTEATLLDLLYQNRGNTVTEAALAALLGDSAAHTNTLAVYLYRLRRKLCADGVNRILTVRGIGYCLTDHPIL